MSSTDSLAPWSGNDQVQPPATAAGLEPEDRPAPDGKDADALRTIGEVASMLGIRQHVLRYWEEQFPMLRPLKRSGGRRYYRPEDVRLVETIDSLVHREGYTLKGAKKVLQGGVAKALKAAPVRKATEVAPENTAPVSQPMQAAQPANTALPAADRAQLIAIRDRLAAALRNA